MMLPILTKRFHSAPSPLFSMFVPHLNLIRCKKKKILWFNSLGMRHLKHNFEVQLDKSLIYTFWVKGVQSIKNLFDACASRKTTWLSRGN